LDGANLRETRAFFGKSRFAGRAARPESLSIGLENPRFWPEFAFDGRATPVCSVRAQKIAAAMHTGPLGGERNE
jgi:hypothetical protein